MGTYNVTPTWQAATSGQKANAGHINQFLGQHKATFVYQGQLRSSQTTGTGVYTDTLNQWMTQTITTASTQTSISYVQLQISTIGGSPTTPLINPLTVSLYTDAGGVPTGSALASVNVASTTVYSSPFWLTVPLAATGLTANGTYNLVVTRVGTAGHYYVMQQSNQATGAATSPDGVTWTLQPYGFIYQVFDTSSTSPTGNKILQIYEDGGARVTQFAYNSNGTISQITEYVAAQTSSTALQQSRNFTYTNGFITGVT
jgi:hypothetical protein